MFEEQLLAKRSLYQYIRNNLRRSTIAVRTLQPANRAAEIGGENTLDRGPDCFSFCGNVGHIGGMFPPPLSHSNIHRRDFQPRCVDDAAALIPNPHANIFYSA